MIKTKHITTLNLADFHKATVGFDRMLSTLSTKDTSNYPPFNLDQIDDDSYVITIAVAGFYENEIDIQHQSDILSITAKSKRDDDTDITNLHRGIGTRDFTRTFALAEHINVQDAELTNGLLRIYLQREVPEELKPKKISIRSIKSLR